LDPHHRLDPPDRIPCPSRNTTSSSMMHKPIKYTLACISGAIAHAFYDDIL
jgi:hypothetical protein